MINYFKFTEGGSFALDGVDYRGMLHVIGSVAYTGTIHTPQSRPLSSKNTFSSNIIQNKLNYALPGSFTEGLPFHLSAAKVYPRDILNINLLNKLLNILNQNNLLLYSASAKYDTNYFNILYRVNNNIPFVYSLSSLGVPTVNKLTKSYLPLSFSTAKDIYRDKLLRAPNPQGSLFICEALSSYTYYNNDAAISGVINSISGVTFSRGISSSLFTHKFNFFNPYEELIYQTNSDNFSIFSIDKYTGVDNVSIIDRLPISDLNVSISPSTVTYGKNYRTALIRDVRNIIRLEIYPIRDTLKLKTTNIQEMGLDQVLAITQRFEDDLLVILGTRGSQVILLQYDIEELLNNDQKNKEHVLADVDFVSVVTRVDSKRRAFSRVISDFDFSITLSNFDSDIIFIKTHNTDGSIDNCQMRSLTHPKLSFTNFNASNIVNLEKKDIINKININIQDYDGILFDTVRKILDIKFAPYGSNVNSIVVSDSYIMTDNAPTLKYLIPPTTSINYDAPYISDSSIGLLLNDILKSILKDVLLIYRYFNQTPRRDINLPTLLPEIDIDNLQIYGNESINIATLNRTLDRIFEFQLLVANSISQV